MHFKDDPVRQVGFSLSDISPHHLSRYFFAASLVNFETRMVDIGCGCGYGTWILWSVTGQAVGVDISSKAINWANEYFKGPVYILSNAMKVEPEGDVATVFEIIEHIENPKELLERMKVKTIIASVPNQEHYPFCSKDFEKDEFPHLRHYTPDEFGALLESAGFKVQAKFCQKSKYKNGISIGTNGKFLIYIASRENGIYKPG